jgi:acetyl esterase/lipase
MSNDDAYTNAAYIPDGAAYPGRWTAEARAWRDRAPPRQIAYGTAPREHLDLFLPVGPARGLVVFVHGGYWRAFDGRTWSHLAAGPVARGWAVALPSYTLAPEARIAGITRQIARAVDRAAAEVEGPLRLAGHSAGGHQVARMLMADVPLDCAPRLAGCVPISPLADLRPLIDTAMNDDLRLDAEEAARESPALHPRDRDVPTTVWVGGAERPAFLDQARWLADAWSVPLVVDRDRHHFDIVEGLTRPDSRLTRAVLGDG